MEQVILTNDLSDLAMDLPIKTGNKNSSFLLRGSLVKNLFHTIHKNPQKRNVYGYLTEISAFKWIFSVMRELIENDVSFREFLKTRLDNQYFPFEQMIRFLRNVLNHSTTTDLTLKLEDYEIQKDFILSPKVQRVNKLAGSAKITLDFIYAKHIVERKGSPDYGVHLQIDFNILRPGLVLEKLVSWHDLYLLAELCFNLSQLADVKSKAKQVPPIKRKKADHFSQPSRTSRSSKKKLASNRTKSKT